VALKLRPVVAGGVGVVVLAAAAWTWFDRTWLYDRVTASSDAPAPLEVRFDDPSGVWVDSAGRVFFAIRRQHRLWALEDGRLRLVAGTGRPGFSGDGRAAVHARLDHPEGLAGDASGRLWVADSGNHRVRVVEPDGRIRTFAGTGTDGFAGDGGPAVAAHLSRPMDVALGPDGSLSIADFGNHRIRRVGPEGTIATVAGSGTPGFSGDGGPAVAARIGEAYGVAVDAAGTLYVADSSNHRVRRVGPDGTIATVAGTGEPGFSGDFGPAGIALFDSPQDLVALEDGALLVGDEHNHRVRRITADGTVLPVAGNGRAGLCGDGGPATEACLQDPEGIALGPDRALWITDGDNHRLRRVDPDGTIDTVAGSGPVGKRAGHDAVSRAANPRRGRAPSSP